MSLRGVFTIGRCLQRQILIGSLDGSPSVCSPRPNDTCLFSSSPVDPRRSFQHMSGLDTSFRPSSISIINGSNSLFALFEEETKKLKLQHRARLVDLESHFQQYHVSVSEQNAKANVRIKELEEEVARLKEELLVARSQRACQPCSCVTVIDCAGEIDLDGLNLNSKIPNSFLPHGEMVASSVDPWVDTFQVQNSRSTLQSPAPDPAGPAHEHDNFVVNAAHVAPARSRSEAANGQS